MQYSTGAPTIATYTNFLRYMNTINIKLDDYLGSEIIPTAGYSGILVEPSSNTQFTWQLSNYVASNRNPVVDTSSTAISYDILYYYSNSFKITADGDLLILGRMK